jgi:hypothetical protein
MIYFIYSSFIDERRHIILCICFIDVLSLAFVYLSSPLLPPILLLVASYYIMLMLLLLLKMLLATTMTHHVFLFFIYLVFI